MLHNQARLFGESLVQRHVLARDVLEDMIEESSSTGLPLPTLLLQKGLVGTKDLAAANAHALGMRFVDFEETMLQPELGDVMPESVARSNQAVAVVVEGDTVLVAFAQPSDQRSLAEVAAAIHSGSGLRMVPAAADEVEVGQALDATYGHQAGGALVGEKMDRDLSGLFQRMVDADASDLHLAVGQPPILRVLGDLHRLTDFPVLTVSRVRELVYSILDKRQQERFEEKHELDTNHAVPGIARFRVNVFLKRNEIAASLRLIPLHVVPFESLGLPESIASFATQPRLVLVTGPTGSGKSTTLASILDIINNTRACHILTIEEPIEYVHESKRALVSQRDVGTDTASFALALRQALRQDPDVILVGEMRDLETISTAISAAETGHLVFATLHTQDVAQSIDRIVDAFPAEQQDQVRIQVAATLQGIVSQTLIPKADGTGRVAAAEVMMATPAIRNLIRDGKIHQVFPMIQSGRRYGMCTLDESLGYLVQTGVITLDEALIRCRDSNELRRYAGIAATA